MSADMTIAVSTGTGRYPIRPEVYRIIVQLREDNKHK